MEFLKKLWNKIKNEDNKKNDVKNINSIKIEDNDNKTNKNKSTDAIKNEFDGLASQINGFLNTFKSQNNANANLLGIIENLYSIRNNLIKKIDEFKIETKLQTKNIEDIKKEYEYTIFCDDSRLIKLNGEDIKRACENDETLNKILSNFKELKDIIANLNVQQLKNINIEFKSWFDKGKNDEIENMREKILDSLKNLCNVINNELIQFFENIFFKKQATEIKKALEKANERLNKLEEENLNSMIEGYKYIAEDIDIFLSRFNLEFNTEAYNSFYSIYSSIIENINKHNKKFYIRDYKVHSQLIDPFEKFKKIEWKIEFDEDGNLLENSNKQFLEIYERLEKYTDITTKNYEKINYQLCKLLKIEPKNFKEYFKKCYLTLKKEEKKMKRPEYKKQKEEEENQKSLKTKEGPKFTKEEKRKLDKKQKELMKKLEKEQKEKEKKEKKEKEKKEKEKKEKEKKEKEKKEKEKKERKKKELEKRKQNIEKLKTNFLTNVTKVFNLASRYSVFTVQKIIDFFNEYYKYYSDLYDIYECLPTKKLINKELDAKIEYTNINNINVDFEDIKMIKKIIRDISNNIPKFEEIKEWFKKISKEKDNNYRGNPTNIFNNKFISGYLLVLKTIKLPAKEDVEKIKEEFPYIKNWID